MSMWSYRHDGFTVHQLPALNDNYIYLIVSQDNQNKEGVVAVVDPAEPGPVMSACSELGLALTHVLNTHHHWDHTGANLELKQQYGCKIVGARDDAARIPGIDIMVDEDTDLTLGTLAVRVLNVPGHTVGHIAYVIGDALFCGDTLFGGGCGRLFEGSPAQMWDSLQKLARLPADTKVYCAHEYTLSNLRFARSVDPDNPELAARISRDTRMRMDSRPTIPSTVGDELATNPFLRPLSSSFCAAYAGATGIPDEALAVFTAIRASKDKA
jgi:hydroxyacylglutathione hydrolase